MSSATANCTVRDVLSLVVFFVIPSGSGETSSPPPSPVASSTTAASTSEEEGLHASPLPHNLSGSICDVSVPFGGGGIAPQALLLTTTVATSEEEGMHLTPLPRNTSGSICDVSGTGPPPYSSGVYFVFPAIRR